MSQSSYLIAGIGKTGLSIARYLSRRHQPFMVFDTRKKAPGFDVFLKEFPETMCFWGDMPDSVLSTIRAVITSPGVSLDHPVLMDLSQQGVPIYGDVECLVREVSAPIIAITGTNGKSTVTTLVGEIAKEAGIMTAVAGNIGDPVLEVLDRQKKYELWVLELSSFQLELILSMQPIAATILNITPDHLDRHHTMQAYISAKQRVYHQTQYAIFNRDDADSMPATAVEKTISFGLDEPQNGQWGIRTQEGCVYLAYGEQCFMAVDAMRIKGKHNWLNALAACALAHSIGIEIASMIAVLERFPGLSHRTQWVRTIDHVDWVDDSKGTNVGATISAVTGLGGALGGKIVLIAGGQGKGADFRDLRDCVRQYVRTVILIGEDAPLLDEALKDLVSIIHAPTLELAVHRAREQAHPHDAVLLSPACASLDMFRDYNHRGDVFKAAVESL